MRRVLICSGRLTAFALATAMAGSLVARAALTGVSGGNQPASNMQPSLAMNYIIRMTGSPSQIGEVVPFAGSFAPAGWAFAHGQTLLVADDADLFARIGNAYGGGGATFALPDLRGRTVVHRGTGVGLTDRALGEELGDEESTLLFNNMPVHAHNVPGGGATSADGGPPGPFNNVQPSLAMNYAVALSGTFPSEGMVQAPTWIGQVRLFAGEAAPAGYASADGQLLPIAQNQALFSLLGTRYGGTGVVTVGLPDLRGRTVIHKGSSDGVATHALASPAGSESVTLSVDQLPSHTHPLPPPANQTDAAGANQPYSNMQPSLTLNSIICVGGNFPSPGMGATEPFLGQVALFAGNFAPVNWRFADGHELQISTNTALFAILGTTYGGNGVTTFGLPDLRGRTIIGAGAGVGLTQRDRGEELGVENSLLSSVQLPAHEHTYAGFNADFDGDSDVDGADFLAWQQSVGITTGATHSQGDANFDGDVDSFDVDVWRAQFGGAPPPPSAPVPEPTAHGLALLAVATLVTARLRHSPR